MSEIRQLCSATLSVRLWVVVQCRGVSFRRSATWRMSRNSRGVIAQVFFPKDTENLCNLGEFCVTSHP